MMALVKLRFYVCILLFLFLCMTVYSQKVHVNVIDSDRSSNCEFTAAIVDSFIQGVAPDDAIMIIGYRGQNESRSNIVFRRLYNAKIYFTEYHKTTTFAHLPEKIVLATGLGRAKEGSLIFYVNGETGLTIYFRKDHDLILSPCYVESKDSCKDTIKSLFYPCKKG